MARNRPTLELAPGPITYRARLPYWAEQLEKPARWKSIRGGRGSAKSHTVAQLMVMRMAGHLDAYPEPRAPVRIVSARAFNVTLEHSVKTAVVHYIKQFGLERDFHVYNNRIDHVNGSQMLFYGVSRSPESFMSMEGLDVLWVEQAEILQDEMTYIAPTVRKPGSELWFVWNPNQRTDYCWRRFVANPQPGDVDVAVTYKDNPFWTKELEEQRKLDKLLEPDLYPWIYLGKPNDGDASTQVLSYAVLSDCVEAYQRGFAPTARDVPLIDAGLDLARGGKDQCALVVRRGPCVEHVSRWPGVYGDASVAARRAHEILSEFGKVYRLYYDGASEGMQREFRAIPGREYAVEPILFGGKVEGKDVRYEGRVYNEERYARRNIQMADVLRHRAINTARLLRGGNVNPDRCLFINPSIPAVDEFLGELAQPKRRIGPATGKWELDKRGGDDVADSPDRFDALCLAFARDSVRGIVARKFA